jgi:hypothetical protein
MAVLALSACGTDGVNAPTGPASPALVAAPSTSSSLTAEPTVVLDIKPRVSPNKVRHFGAGRLRAAIVGTEDFDVRNVNLRSLTLEGVHPRRVGYRDLTSPAGATNVITEYRVNCGGPVLAADGDDWLEDSDANQSPYVNTGFASVTTETVDTSHPSLPAGTPMELFQSERWDWTSSPEMLWDFPVADGDYVVRLYFTENYVHNQEPGKRLFDVTIEGETVLDDYDIFADVGGHTGVMKEFRTTVEDGELTLDFMHVLENPTVSAIEILSATGEVVGAQRSVQDGIEDLVMTFSKRQLRRALGSRLHVGDEIPLTLEGELLDGTPFTAEDVIVFTGRIHRERPGRHRH